jgi:hypothetical protein
VCGNVLEKRKRSPLSSDFAAKAGEIEENLGITAIGRMFRTRSRDFFSGLVLRAAASPSIPHI